VVAIISHLMFSFVHIFVSVVCDIISFFHSILHSLCYVILITQVSVDLSRQIMIMMGVNTSELKLSF